MLNVTLCKSVNGNNVLEKWDDVDRTFISIVNKAINMDFNDSIVLESDDSLTVYDVLYVLNKIVPTNEIIVNKQNNTFKFIKISGYSKGTDRNIKHVQLFNKLDNGKKLNSDDENIINAYYNGDVEAFLSFYNNYISNDTKTLLTKYVYHRDDLMNK